MATLFTLLRVALTLLVVMTAGHEATHAQDQVETLALEAGAQMHRDLLRSQQSLQVLNDNPTTPQRWSADVAESLPRMTAMRRIEWRRPDWQLTAAVDSPDAAALFTTLARQDIVLDAAAACASARRRAAPAFSRSYFVPLADGAGQEVIDLCLPRRLGERDDGFQIATFSLKSLLEAALPSERTRRHKLSFIEGDAARLARAGLPRGRGATLAERGVDLPGTPLLLLLSVDSGPAAPSLVPNLATTLVLGRSIALFALVLVLARKTGRRARAEAALAEALAFRRAMEDSLITGPREPLG